MKLKSRNKKWMIRLAVAALAFLGLAGLCIYTVFIRPGLEQDTVIYMDTQVARGDLVQGIIESGNVELAESNISFDLEINYEEDEDDDEDEDEANRYLQIEKVYVAQGQRIQEGDPLFQLTQESISTVRRKLENSRSEAQVELAEARSDYNDQLQSAKSTYSTSRAEADTASRTLDVTVSRLQEQINLLYADIQVLQAEINDYNEKLTDEDTLEEYSDLKYAYEQAQKKMDETDSSSVAAYTANYASLQSAKQAFEQLDDQLQSYRDGITDNQESIEKKNEEILEAQTSLDQSQTEAKQSYDSSVLNGSLAGDIYSYTLSSLQETVDEAQLAVDEAQELLDDFEAFVGEDGILYADGSGLVTAVYYEEDDRLMTTGTMLSYATEDSYSITIDVSEEDISYISVGDSVDIEFNAYPDEVYGGTVSAVTASADSSYSTTVNYPVTIHISGDTTKLYGGMNGNITFITDSVSDVLYVSASAVETREDGTSFVYVQNAAGEMEEKDVTTGFSNGSEIEITDGLEEGETIYIASTVRAGQSEESLRQSGDETENSGEIDSTTETTGGGEQGGFPEGMDFPSGGMDSMSGGGQPAMP